MKAKLATGKKEKRVSKKVGRFLSKVHIQETQEQEELANVTTYLLISVCDQEPAAGIEVFPLVPS